MSTPHALHMHSIVDHQQKCCASNGRDQLRSQPDLSHVETLELGAQHERNPETDLIKRAQDGDRCAYAALYRLHREAIWRYLRHRTGCPHASDDLLGDVFLACMRRLSAYQDRGVPFRHWLYRVATRHANRWARRSRGRADAAEQLEHIPRSGSCDTASASIESIEQQQALAAALRSIKPVFQSALVLHHLEGLSVEYTAKTLGCRVGTVKSRLARGRAALARQLELQTAR